MADERASMLERLSEGDRDKVEAAVSRHGDLRADRLVKDYAARAQRRLKSIDRQFAAANPKTRRCGTRTRRASPTMKGGPSQK